MNTKEVEEKLPSWYFLLKEWWEEENEDGNIHAS
jgi:hypothetical protein